MRNLHIIQIVYPTYKEVSLLSNIRSLFKLFGETAVLYCSYNNKIAATNNWALKAIMCFLDQIFYMCQLRCTIRTGKDGIAAFRIVMSYWTF